MTDAAKRILLVDGNPSRQEQLGRIFRELNYDVVLLASKKEALAAIDVQSPDLVLASVEGASEGFDLCSQARAKEGKRPMPVILMSAQGDAEQAFLRHQKEKTRADGYIRMPVPPEDVVDWVERLIGLPLPPNGTPIGAPHTTGGSASGEVDPLHRQIEELQEQLHFYQKQLDQVSVTGEKEAREMDVFLKELQDDLTKVEKERETVREELRLAKADLAKKDKDAEANEKQIGDLNEEFAKERTSLQQELENVRAAINEKEEKHKKAQNVLREYYKPKLVRVTKLEKTVEALEDELVRLRDDMKLWTEKTERAAKERDQARKDLDHEREKTQKLRDTLSQASKIFGE